MILTLASAAFACGSLYLPFSSTGTAVTADLRALYLVGDDATTMVTQVSWTGTAASFALLIPIPGVIVGDAVVAADPDALNELIGRTDPSFSGFASCSVGMGVYGCASSSTYDDTSSVAVLGSYDAGPYDVQLLDPSADGDITTWLQDNGYDVPDAAEGALSDYAAEGFYFLAVQLREVPAATDATGLPALAVTYAGTDVVYPLRLGATSTAEELEVLVMIASAHRMEPAEDPWVAPELGTDRPFGDALDAWYNGRLRYAIEGEGRRAWGIEYAEAVEADHPMFASLVANGLEGPSAFGEGTTFVTRYRTWMTPSQMTGDVRFRVADTDDTYIVEGTTFAAAPFALFGMSLWVRRRMRRA